MDRLAWDQVEVAYAPVDLVALVAEDRSAYAQADRVAFAPAPEERGALAQEVRVAVLEDHVVHQGVEADRVHLHAAFPVGRLELQEDDGRIPLHEQCMGSE